MLVFGLGGCTIPRGVFKTSGMVLESDAAPDAFVVEPISASMISRFSQPVTASFSKELISAKDVRFDTLEVDDRVNISIWEPVAAPQTFSVGQGGKTDFGEIIVDDLGFVHVPYAGALKAAGRTVEQLQKDIVASLKRVVLNPQVQVRVVERGSKIVTVQGMSGKSGRYQLDSRVRRLSHVLALAAPDQKSPEMLQVAIRRDGMSEQVRLSDLYRDTSLDIALRPNDSIIVSEVSEHVNILGASGAQGQYRITSRSYSVLDAIAEAKGLEDERADPRAVFLFRQNSQLDPAGERPVIYQIDLSRPEVVFLARNLPARDKDVIYIGDASLTDLRKVSTAISLFIIGSSRAFQ
jgi:polysaccharide export outer membrane protein